MSSKELVKIESTVYTILKDNTGVERVAEGIVRRITIDWCGTQYNLEVCAKQFGNAGVSCKKDKVMVVVFEKDLIDKPEVELDHSKYMLVPNLKILPDYYNVYEIKTVNLSILRPAGDTSCFDISGVKLGKISVKHYTGGNDLSTTKNLLDIMIDFNSNIDKYIDFIIGEMVEEEKFTLRVPYNHRNADVENFILAINPNVADVYMNIDHSTSQVVDIFYLKEDYRIGQTADNPSIGFNDDNNIIILADKQLPSKLKLFGVYWNIECKAKLERAFRLDSSPIIPNYNVYEIISMSIDSDVGLKINQIDNYIDKLVDDKG